MEIGQKLPSLGEAIVFSHVEKRGGGQKNGRSKDEGVVYLEWYVDRSRSRERGVGSSFAGSREGSYVVD
jgi:hypothetical protein